MAKGFQRCFSGKAGVWLKKRTKAPKSSKVDDREIGFADSCGCKDYHCAHLKIPVDCGFEWDDDQSRPVYRQLKSFELAPGQLTNATDDDTSSKSGDETTIEPSSFVNRSFNVSAWNERSKKRKAFGSDRMQRPHAGFSFRSLLQPGGVAASPISQVGSNNVVPLNRILHGAGRLTSTTTNIECACRCEADDNSKPCKCSVGQVSDLAKESESNFDSKMAPATSTLGLDDLRFDFGRTPELDEAPMRRKRVKTSKRATKVASKASGVDSVTKAREFFEKLAEHRLTFDTSATPRHLSKRACCRTLRARRLFSPNLTEEYEKYVKACRESEVQPLSRLDYVTNRGEYFRKNELYDGFLEE